MIKQLEHGSEQDLNIWRPNIWQYRNYKLLGNINI